MKKFSNISFYLSYSVSVITFLLGIITVSGIILEYVPTNLRITFGIVLMLWGIYRFAMTRIRSRQLSKEEAEEE